MKMELTNELKARFFALYWGQEVIIIADELTTLDEMSAYYKDDFSHLLLRPLLVDDGCAGMYIYRVPHLLDYLRSKGFALPFMGISVEEMVQAGWIKLKE